MLLGISFIVVILAVISAAVILGLAHLKYPNDTKTPDGWQKARNIAIYLLGISLAYTMFLAVSVSIYMKKYGLALTALIIGGAAISSLIFAIYYRTHYINQGIEGTTAQKRLYLASQILGAIATFIMMAILCQDSPVWCALMFSILTRR